jgi:hypothetical protein
VLERVGNWLQGAAAARVGASADGPADPHATCCRELRSSSDGIKRIRYQ